MRLMTTISPVGPMLGRHYGLGWAVAFGDDPAHGARHLVANWKPHAVMPGWNCLTEEVGVHLMIVAAEPPADEPAPA